MCMRSYMQWGNQWAFFRTIIKLNQIDYEEQSKDQQFDRWWFAYCNPTKWNKWHYFDRSTELYRGWTNQYHPYGSHLRDRIVPMTMCRRDECRNLMRISVEINWKWDEQRLDRPWQALMNRCPSSENCPQKVDWFVAATTCWSSGNNLQTIKRDQCWRFRLETFSSNRNVLLDTVGNWSDQLHANWFMFENSTNYRNPMYSPVEAQRPNFSDR